MRKIFTFTFLIFSFTSTLLSLEPISIGFYHPVTNTVDVQLKLVDYTTGADILFEGDIQNQLLPDDSGIIYVMAEGPIQQQQQFSSWADIDAADINTFYTVDVYVNNQLFVQFRLDQILMTKAIAKDGDYFDGIMDGDLDMQEYDIINADNIDGGAAIGLNTNNNGAITTGTGQITVNGNMDINKGLDVVGDNQNAPVAITNNNAGGLTVALDGAQAAIPNAPAGAYAAILGVANIQQSAGVVGTGPGLGVYGVSENGTAVLASTNDGKAINLEVQGDGEALQISMDNSSTKDAITVYNNGTGRTLYLEQISNNTSATSLQIRNEGTGKGIVTDASIDVHSDSEDINNPALKLNNGGVFPNNTPTNTYAMIIENGHVAYSSQNFGGLVNNENITLGQQSIYKFSSNGDISGVTINDGTVEGMTITLINLDAGRIEMTGNNILLAPQNNLNIQEFTAKQLIWTGTQWAPVQ